MEAMLKANTCKFVNFNNC